MNKNMSNYYTYNFCNSNCVVARKEDNSMIIPNSNTIGWHISAIGKANVEGYELEDFESGFMLLFKYLLKKNPQKEEDFQTLLKLNCNDYKNTVLQMINFLEET